MLHEAGVRGGGDADAASLGWVRTDSSFSTASLCNICGLGNDGSLIMAAFRGPLTGRDQALIPLWPLGEKKKKRAPRYQQTTTAAEFIP